MKMSGIILLTIMLIFSIEGFGQEALSRSLKNTESKISTVKRVGAFGEIIDNAAFEKEVVRKKTQPPKSKVVHFHTAKKISKESGYFIQLYVTNNALDIEHKVFQEFGNLKVQENSNSGYCYLIGSFVTQKAADNFLKGIIISRYPNAKVVELKNGKRK